MWRIDIAGNWREKQRSSAALTLSFVESASYGPVDAER
jgi:hypothetical protein